MKEKVIKFFAPVATVLAAAPAFAADPVIDYTGITTSLLGQVTAAVTAALPVMGVIMGIVLGVAIFRRFAGKGK